MKSSRRLAPLAAVAVFALAACGGSDASTDTTPATEPAAVTEPADDFTETETTIAATDAPIVDTTVASATTVVDENPVATTVGSAAAAGAATATMSEWSIDAPTEYAAGEITFTAANMGSFPHEFVVIEGESYESLPLEEGGSIIEEDLPTGALLGRTPKIGGGSSEDLTVTLAPGNYVLVCNLGGGANSHAAQGQRLSISVT